MIFIGHFIHMTNQEEVAENDRRHGEFQMILEATDLTSALEGFRERIALYRKDRDFFEGVCRIYLVQLLELDRLPLDTALMVNFKSVAGDPVMPFIGCSLPSQDTDACRIFDWNNSGPEIDGQNEQLFMTFDA